MPVRTEISEEQEHPPSLSGTRSAWSALALLVLLVTGWVFFNPLACGVLKGGLMMTSWWRGEGLLIGKLSLESDGSFQACGIEWRFGPKDHPSLWKSDWLVLRPTPVWELIRLRKSQRGPVIRELLAGKSKLLLDQRGKVLPDAGKKTPPRSSDDLPLSLASLLPASCTAGPLEVVVIGEGYRAAINGLYLRLPDRWAGKVSFQEAAMDVGPWHFAAPSGETIAFLDRGKLQLGALDLGNEIRLKELTLVPRDEGLDVGIRGLVGKGLLRGDGTVGAGGNPHSLEVTLVGENLSLGVFSSLMSNKNQATGTIRQARLTFRGDTSRPLEADSSLRLIATDFLWEGRGWESLRLAATLTGRNLTVTELNMQQRGNELTAEGQSRLPEDWHAALKAPFTARFSAQLEDAGALGALAGRDFSELGGGLSLDGEIRGADNRADGYCNLTGNALRIRELPVDWMRGCLIFEGKTTHLSFLDAWSGADHLALQGTMANSQPHSYRATADVTVQNLSKRLSQLGVTTAPSMGAGGVKGTWQGEGSMEAHAGAFQAYVSKWVSPWTKSGMTGRFEGAYDKGKLNLTKAEFFQDDLKLGLKLSAMGNKLEASEIVAVREGKIKPLVEGSLSLPLNATAFWQSGNLSQSLGMTEAMDVKLALHGIKAEELTDLLGQPRQCTGALEGTVRASGTPERPVIHSALQITQFSASRATPPQDLNFTADFENGHGAAALVQQPAATSPMRIKMEMPLRFVNEKGKLRMANETESISGTAVFHEVPLDGWLDLAGIHDWPLHQQTVDGAIKLSGTFEKSAMHGDITLKAGEGMLFGPQKLRQIVAPFALHGTAGQLTNGTANCGGGALAITGSLDWGKSPAMMQLQLSGKKLPLALALDGGCNGAAKLESLGSAELTLTAKGTNNPTLGGTVTLTELTGNPAPKLTPCFAPPGIRVLPATPAETVTNTDAASNLQLDLALKTEGLITVQSSPAKPSAENARDSSTMPLPQVAMDLHLQGMAKLPQLTGAITATTITVSLPQGNFTMPEAKLRLDAGSASGQITAMAYGMTRRGLCALTLGGTLAETGVGFSGPVDATAPDLLMSLAMPATRGETAKMPLQGIFWSRQAHLFPLPSVSWMTARFEKNAPGALGFYGAPWLWSFDLGSGNATTTAQTGNK